MKKNSTLCPCCSQREYTACCEQYISRKALPNTAEALMRSRFTAYAIREHQYILDTYAPQKRASISLHELATDQQDTHWTCLQITSTPQFDKVAFKAYYQYQNNWFLMHEESSFIKIKNQWFYLDGIMFDDTGLIHPRRNDSCPCGSGQKFKKCCLV